MSQTNSPKNLSYQMKTLERYGIMFLTRYVLDHIVYHPKQSTICCLKCSEKAPSGSWKSSISALCRTRVSYSYNQNFEEQIVLDLSLSNFVQFIIHFCILPLVLVFSSQN